MARKDRIHIEHLGKEYIIDIMDCKPDVVVDIVECDVEVDIEYKDLLEMRLDIIVEKRTNQLFQLLQLKDPYPFKIAWRLLQNSLLKAR